MFEQNYQPSNTPIYIYIAHNMVNEPVVPIPTFNSCLFLKFFFNCFERTKVDCRFVSLMQYYPQQYVFDRKTRKIEIHTENYAAELRCLHTVAKIMAQHNWDLKQIKLLTKIT